MKCIPIIRKIIVKPIATVSIKNACLWVLFISSLALSSCQSNKQYIFLGELAFSGSLYIKNKIENYTDEAPIIINGTHFRNGCRVSSHSMLYLNLDNDAVQISGIIGNDNTEEYHAAACNVTMYIIGDDKVLWTSKPIGFFEPADTFNLSLKGIDVLQLWFLGDKGNFRGNVLLGDASITYNKIKPTVYIPELEKGRFVSSIEPDEPQINMAKVYGTKPGAPIILKIPTTGKEPIEYSSTNLPKGLKLNKNTGIITGVINEKGNYSCIIQASNSFGVDTEELLFKTGDTLSLTPPMGWSSWNIWGESISQEKVMDALHAIKKNGLDKYGYSYINIDDGWQGDRGGAFFAIQPNHKFPNMKGMIDSIHAQGLKFGIYSSPWKTTYAGKYGALKIPYKGSSADNTDGTNATHELEYGVYPFHQHDVNQWNEWGVDYLKYDWWPNDIGHTSAMSKALQEGKRNILFSISNAAPFEQAENWKQLTNLWRTTGDIYDSWACVVALGYAQEKWLPYMGPGHWIDPDMLILGTTGVGEPEHQTRLSANEQCSYFSFWAMVSAPLLLGCNLAELDSIALSIIKNPEIIAINQDALGAAPKLMQRDNLTEIWVKPLYDGSFAVALFNHGLKSTEIDFTLEEAGLKGSFQAYDLWLHKNTGTIVNSFSSEVPAHGVAMFKFKK